MLLDKLPVLHLKVFSRTGLVEIDIVLNGDRLAVRPVNANSIADLIDTKPSSLSNTSPQLCSLFNSDTNLLTKLTDAHQAQLPAHSCLIGSHPIWQRFC